MSADNPGYMKDEAFDNGATNRENPDSNGDVDKTSSNYEDIVIDDANEEDDESGKCYKAFDTMSEFLSEFFEDNRRIISITFLVASLAAYIIFLIFACLYSVQTATTLLILTGIGLALFVYTLVRNLVGERIYGEVIKPVTKRVDEAWPYIRWPLLFILLAGLVAVLYFLTRDNPIQLTSLGGLAILILATFVMSKHPRHVKWRPVVWGFALQFLLGLFILRTYAGFVIFNWLGNLIQIFIGYAEAGSQFVFGDNYLEHYFAFVVLPIVIYFSSAISILYYLGVMQVVIKKIAWIMQRTMKTTASESLSAAGNIFIGQTEAPLLIRPYLKDMTRSEIHAVMTGGFATIAGGVLGAFIANGISAVHLISASVMSAPAALAISKLIYPETEQSKTVTEEDVQLPKGPERNVIEAASKGAADAVPLVLNIAANLITFLALLAFANGILGYLGGLVGYPELSVEIILSYMFMPIAFIMGVEWSECMEVGRLIGLKTFLNEFVAYGELAVILENRNKGLITFSPRSETIATYALCGFSNIASIGIQIGGLTPMAPSKGQVLAEVALRALIAGTIACFSTACIAGILYVPMEVEVADMTTISMTTISMTTINMTTMATFT